MPVQCVVWFSKRQEDVLQTYWTPQVRYAGHVFKTFEIETYFTRYQYVPVSGNASVFKTSGRRFTDLLDVFGLSSWKRLRHVLGTNVFHRMLSERVCFRCCFSFPNVGKTFCKRTGRFHFVTLDTFSTRCR